MADPGAVDTSRGAQAGPEPRVAVCVATRRRPQALLRLLRALDSQGGAGFRMRAVVVDNDEQGSARPVCEAMAARLSYPLDYVAEKRRGIPQARNRALALGLADEFVAFVDDDEVPEPGWLAELVRVQRETGADAVTGPCLARFEEPPPAWIAEGAFFERPRFATGEERDVAFTHNALVRSDALDSLSGLFDERLALCGGSDVELFRRFAGAGRRIVWADEARVHDAVPPGRARLGWILRRARRVGASNAWIERQHAPGAGTLARVLAHGAWCVLKAVGLLLLSLPGGRAAAARALHLAWFGLGRLQGAFGFLVEEYADPARPTAR